MPRRASDIYIQLNKKICNRAMIDKLTTLAQQWEMSTQEVCYKLIQEGLFTIFDKREKLGKDLIK